MSAPRRTRGIKITPFRIWAAFIGVGLLAAWRMAHSSGTWSEQIILDGQNVTVTINWTYRRGLPCTPHDWLIPPGESTYTTWLRFPGGRTTHFRVQSEYDLQPRAIWKLQGEIYVACGDLAGNWLVGSLDADGTITPVSRDKLPDGPRPWNLEPASGRRDCDENFDKWFQ